MELLTEPDDVVSTPLAIAGFDTPGRYDINTVGCDVTEPSLLLAFDNRMYFAIF